MTESVLTTCYPGSMPDYTLSEVAAFKLWVANRTAQLLSVGEEFLDASELIDRIRRRDPKAAEMVSQFFASYDAWYELSERMIRDEPFRVSHQTELQERTAAKDRDRQSLIAHLNKR